MAPEEKQLLLQDLCARIPHRTFVCLNPGAYNKPEICALTGVHGEQIHLDVDTDPFRINNIKPYLRSMSSMTEEEKKEFQACHCIYELHPDFQPMMCNLANELNMFDWLLAHHFDFRGLIDKGLALEAPAGMYKTE